MLTFDEFIETRIPPEQHAIVQALRELVRECVPSANEAISYDMPCWIVKKIIAYVNSSKTGITFSFTLGAQIDDNYGLLKGKAKWARYVKVRDVKQIEANRAALCSYLEQALKIDAK